MDRIFRNFQRKLNSTQLDFVREFINDPDWNERLIALKGARGVGKTTLFLQYIKLHLQPLNNVIYVSLDEIYFQDNTLTDFIEESYLNGITHFFFDEVHKYPNWSIELKNAYDTYADIKLRFTSSSLLEIHKSEADLSRRAVVYTMEGFSFREYLIKEYEIELPIYTFEKVLESHREISQSLPPTTRIIPLFKEYLKYGFYPFYMEGKNSYYNKLTNIINMTLETDIPAIHNTEYKTIFKLKKLLYLVATSLPYQPNISKLSEQLETSSRNATLQYLDFLEKASLITNLKTGARGKNYLAKPDKVYLANTNLIHAIGKTNENIGNIRETFFINQVAYRNKVNTSKTGDFLVNDIYTIEVGGKHKKIDQIRFTPFSYVASDDIEHGSFQKIPLWQFGLLY